MISKKNIFFLLGLFFLLSFSFASAKIYSEGNASFVEVGIEPGWNLIAGISFSELPAKNSELDFRSILSSYYYDSKLKKDVKIRPNYEAKDISALELYRNAFWVFSLKAGKLNYKVSPSFIDRNRLGGHYQFYKGTNLIAINDEMYGKSVLDLRGDCEIDRVQFWNAKIRNWTSLNPNTRLDFQSRDELTGKGLGIIVKNDCNFFGDKASYDLEIFVKMLKSVYQKGETIKIK